MGTKLVRDRIGTLVWSIEEAKVGLRPVVSVDEHKRLLLMKLLEEAGELVAAQTPEERLEEAADVLEVLCSILEVFDGKVSSITDIVAMTRQKYTERGGFEIGTVWEGTARQ